jgi:hypothetical protein
LLIARLSTPKTKTLTPLLPFFDAGHAKVKDKFLSDPRDTYCDTVLKDKILFHYTDASDPDWMVRHCYLLMMHLQLNQ